MTNEEIENAIKGIDSVCEDHQFNIGCFDKCETDGRNCFVKIAKEALEKQMPKRPDESYDGYADGYPVMDYYCPCCGREVDDTDHHCECGQTLDWSFTEEDVKR